MKILISLFTILGTVLADCGCLKCSKHLAVAGEVPGAPGQAPVKVIFRCDSGYPNICDTGLIGGYPIQPVSVQVPITVPKVPQTCGSEVPVVIQPFYRPLSISHGHGSHYLERGHLAGSYYMDGRPSFSGVPVPEGEFLEYQDRLGLPLVGEYNILPVQVQQPIPPPPARTCQTISGLRTSLDRVIVPAPPLPPHHSEHGIHERVVHTCCGPISCPLAHHSTACCSSPSYHQPPHTSSCLLGRYDISQFETSANVKSQAKNRSKRQLPILQNGYKFFINMLPKTIQEPIIKTVNSMALIHPDPKLRKMYNLPPPKPSLQDKIAQKHKENVAVLKQKLFGELKQSTEKYDERYYSNRYKENRHVPDKYERYYLNPSDNHKYDDYKYFSKKYVNQHPYQKKYHDDLPYARKFVDENLIDYEAENFVESLQNPQLKTRKHVYSSDVVQNHNKDSLRTKSPLLSKLLNTDNNWSNEYSSSDIYDNHFGARHRGDEMSEKEKARFLLKLKKLNTSHNRFKRSTDAITNNNINHKSKRSIIIDSEELSLPLYQIRIKDSYEDNEIPNDSEEDYVYDSHEDRIVASPTRDIYNSREALLRRAIKEELRHFKRRSDEEESIEYLTSHQKKKWISKYPLLNILTFPVKVLKDLNNEDDFPIIGAVPKMIVGTKRYIKDFGKNLKKNFLHFTSDMIGDFDHYGPTDSLLDSIVERRRFKRSLEGTSLPENLSNVSDTVNFQPAPRNKVRKKRYILKMVDDDEVEAMLRKKLGKMIEEPDKIHNLRRKHRTKPNNFENSEEQRKIIEHLYGGLMKHKTHTKENSSEVNTNKRKYVKNSNKLHSDSIEELRKKIIIEPIKPKLIIDNNGLPFMEINGYKRPIFLKKDKKIESELNSVENVSSDPYGSSEEVNLQKINSVIIEARNYKDLPANNPKIPLKAIKEKISQLLDDIDVLMYMDCEKFDQIYDDLFEIQSIKTSIVQSWKRIIMDKKINDLEAKIDLLEKFTQLQQIKDAANKNIVYTLYEERQNSFAVKKLIGILARLQKVQCIINQVVDSFREKFKTGAKFDVAMEVKYVDYLSSVKLVQARTRNDMTHILVEERDATLQDSIQLLEKLKQMLVEDDNDIIEEEANLLWEMQHVQKMQVSTIEEMSERMEGGIKIRKCLKILFDLERKLIILNDKEKKLRCSVSNELSDEEEQSDEHDLDEDKALKSKKKWHVDDYKKKWHKKMEKQKTMVEKNFKKKMNKLKKLKDLLRSSGEIE